MDTNWLYHQKFIQDLFAQGAQVYLVGGNVRDLLINRSHKDFDLLVRKLPFTPLVETLKKHGQVNVVGKSFGVVKFRPSTHPEIEIDLSLPRLEKSTGTGHRDFDVDFNPDLPVEQDLVRRDFTINAMALSLKDQSILDPFGGQDDIKTKSLRIVFNEAFVEDPLRMLRAVQFAARFLLTVDPQTLESMTCHAALIKTVAPERIILEIRKLFDALKPSVGFHLMRQTGILPLIFPFVADMIGVLQPMKQNEDVYDHTMKVLDASRSANEMTKAGDLDIMFAALFHDAGKPKTAGFDDEKEKVTFYGHQLVSTRIAKQWLRHYKATTIGIDIPKVLNLIHNHMFETKAFYTEKAIRRFINKVGVDQILDLIDLRIADKKGGRFPDSVKGIITLRKRIKDEISKKPPFGPKDLAINGHDLITLGIKPSPLMGKIQAFLVDQVLDDPELNTPETLKKLVKEHFIDQNESFKGDSHDFQKNQESGSTDQVSSKTS